MTGRAAPITPLVPRCNCTISTSYDLAGSVQYKLESIVNKHEQIAFNVQLPTIHASVMFKISG